MTAIQVCMPCACTTFVLRGKIHMLYVRVASGYRHPLGNNDVRCGIVVMETEGLRTKGARRQRRMTPLLLGGCGRRTQYCIFSINRLTKVSAIVRWSSGLATTRFKNNRLRLEMSRAGRHPRRGIRMERAMVQKHAQVRDWAAAPFSSGNGS
jgi:hypothetical protein